MIDKLSLDLGLVWCCDQIVTTILLEYISITNSEQGFVKHLSKLLNNWFKTASDPYDSTVPLLGESDCRRWSRSKLMLVFISSNRYAESATKKAKQIQYPEELEAASSLSCATKTYFQICLELESQGIC